MIQNCFPQFTLLKICDKKHLELMGSNIMEIFTSILPTPQGIGLDGTSGWTKGLTPAIFYRLNLGIHPLTSMCVYARADKHICKCICI